MVGKLEIKPMLFNHSRSLGIAAVGFVSDLAHLTKGITTKLVHGAFVKEQSPVGSDMLSDLGGVQDAASWQERTSRMLGLFSIAKWKKSTML
jgi:hypothetical protein